jgi:hypothetical protein
MKRAERHHLKDNELAHLAASAAGYLQDRQGPFLTIAGAVVVVLVAVGGYVAYRNSADARAHTALAGALAVEEARVGPPVAFGTQPQGLSFVSEREKDEAARAKFKEVADAYPGSDAGLFARYRQAALSMTLDEPKDAIAIYQQVISDGGDGVYAQMARLGLAEAQAQSGDYESAINTFREMSQLKDGPLPVDGILMQLGRAQASAGKSADAEQTFNKLVQEHPDSLYVADARQQLDSLKKAS